MREKRRYLGSGNSNFLNFLNKAHGDCYFSRDTLSNVQLAFLGLALCIRKELNVYATDRCSGELHQYERRYPS